MSGTRPSALFEWNDPEEWDERLAFDLEVSSMILKILIQMKQFPGI